MKENTSIRLNTKAYQNKKYQISNNNGAKKLRKFKRDMKKKLLKR